MSTDLLDLFRPLDWHHEARGRLRAIILAFLDGEELPPGPLVILKWYIAQWVRGITAAARLVAMADGEVYELPDEFYAALAVLDTATTCQVIREQVIPVLMDAGLNPF